MTSEAQPGQEHRMDVKPPTEMRCDECGKPIEPRAWYTASTDGRAWHHGCAPAEATRPTADLGEDGELDARLRRYKPFDDYGISNLVNPDGPEAADRLILYREALAEAEAEARRFAGFYPEGSDWRNTFVIFADKIAVLSRSGG